MKFSKDLSRGSELIRRLRIGATVVAGQVVVRAGVNGPGEIEDPSDVNTFTKAAGVTLEAGTYSTSSPHVGVLTSISPTAVFRGRASGGTAADTAHTTATLLTQDTASTTVITDTAVADLDYSTGLILAVTGANAGHARILTSQVDSTSCTVSVAFASSVAVNDTLLRTYAPFVRGVELTTDFCQFNNLLASGEALDTSSIGSVIVYEVFVDGSSLDMNHGDSADSGRDAWIPILNASDPMLEFEVVFNDHAFNRID